MVERYQQTGGTCWHLNVNRRENRRYHTGQLLDALMLAVASLRIPKTPCSANLVQQDITSAKSPSFCMTTFRAGLTNLTALLPQSHDSSCYIIRRIVAPPPHWLHTLNYAHTTTRTLPSCDVRLGWLMFPAPEAGDFVGLILLYALQLSRNWQSISGLWNSASRSSMCL
jgi:hypothetical protein